MKGLRLLIILVMSATLFGCAKSNSGSQENSSFSTLITPRKVVAVVSRNQFLANYLSCTGLPAENVTNDTRNEADAALTKMAEEGDVDKISAPMLMAFVKVGSEVCDDLIAYERTLDSRRFFMGFNLNNTRDGAQMDMGTTIRSLASSCWGRQPTADEVSMIINNIGQTALSTATNQNAALYVCTAILGASAAVKF